MLVVFHSSHMTLIGSEEFEGKTKPPHLFNVTFRTYLSSSAARILLLETCHSTDVDFARRGETLPERTVDKLKAWSQYSGGGVASGRQIRRPEDFRGER